MSTLVVLMLLSLGVLAIVFGSLTLWRWMDLQAAAAQPDRAEARLRALETEVAELRALVHDAIIESDVRMGAEPSVSQTVRD